MRQVLFHVPIPFTDSEFPIFGYGAMLFLAFLVGILMAAWWRAPKAGIAPERVYDIAFVVFVCGLAGARITYMIQYHVPVADWYRIWEGGLVLYGSVIGGLVGYGVAYVLVLRKYQLDTLRMADIVAPSIALGICLGRLGCFLNGCCYGNVACSDCPAVHFPLSGPARYELVARGLQTAVGFTTKLKDGAVFIDRVEPGSPAYESGLRDDDKILKVDGKDLSNSDALAAYLFPTEWPKGKTDLQLTVERRGKEEDLATFYPRTLGLHPTQLYESISMFLLMLLLLAYEPFRRREGELAVILILCYAIHRFLNEVLRNDTEPVAFGMTLSQNISIGIFLAGLVLAWWVWRVGRTPAQPGLGGKAPEGPVPAAAGAKR
jgi:prolipoprotein diacylglyceryltransferase